MPIKITGVPPLGFAGQAQQTNASKASHYGVKTKASKPRKRASSKKKPAGAKKRKTSKKPKPGTKAWMTYIRGMGGKKKRK